MARSALQWSVRDLAAKAAMSPNTVTAVETGSDVRATTMERLEVALSDAGAEFIAENGGGPGVRLAKRKGKRR